MNRRVVNRREAADWLARLHAEDCAASEVVRFRDWIGRDPAHAVAFERASELWELAGGLVGEGPTASLPAPVAMRASLDAGRLARRTMLAGTAALAGLALMPRHPAEARSFWSGIGDCRTVTLAASWSATLDTITELLADERNGAPALRLVQGQADLAGRTAASPLSLDLGACRVQAAGGSHLQVSRIDEHVGVTNIGGAVRVTAASGVERALAPGERWRLVPGGSAVIDRPDLADLAAWRDGFLVFRDTSLAVAVAEMNRYSRTPLSLNPAAFLGRLRISGQFRSRDLVGFGRALTQILPVRLRHARSLVLEPA